MYYKDNIVIEHKFHTANRLEQEGKRGKYKK